MVACHVPNRIPTNNKEITPIKEWGKKKKSQCFLTCEHGVVWTKLLPINKKHKLRSKIVDCLFLGYTFHIVGYRFLIVNSGEHVRTIMKSRDITFFENIFPIKDGTCLSR